VHVSDLQRLCVKLQDRQQQSKKRDHHHLLHRDDPLYTAHNVQEQLEILKQPTQSSQAQKRRKK
jgi:hypothetical protein